MSLERFGYAIRHAGSINEAGLQVDRYMKEIPAWVYATNGKARIREGFMKYAECTMDREQKLRQTNSGLRELSERRCEEDVKSHFITLTDEIKAHNPGRYYLEVPLKTFFRGAVFHSFSFPWPVLEAGGLPKWATMGAKAVFFLLNAFLWVSCFILIFWKKQTAMPPSLKRMIAFLLLAFLLFHIVIFRYFEARYFLPLYPVLIICSLCLIAGSRTGYKRPGQPIPARTT
jgi:hypothetical protein